MSPVTDEIITQLKSMTLLDAAELVSQIEETFGVDAKSPAGGIAVMPIVPGQSASQGAQEQKTTFDVVLEAISESSRVAALKAVRSLTNLGLKEAKDFCASLPKVVKASVSKEEAESAKSDLEAAGGTVVVKLNKSL